MGKSAGDTLLFMQRLWDLTHAMNVRSRRMSRDLGVTGPQRIVIRMIGLTPGCSATALAKSLAMHPSTLTGILSRLERDDMIARTIDGDDRRRSLFDLTAKGKRIDRSQKGTAEGAIRRALSRADDRIVEATRDLVDLMITELERAD
ncbi:MAG: MarR family transcriptional regulator [Deltaproteobacteria bacterium]|nr:MarR family transcriptional regulator [Deltaproteobacteria bacterium]